MKKICLLLLMWLVSIELVGQGLQVSDTQRYLEKDDGKPFLWLGDTAWELFHRLNREEANYYLEKRAICNFDSDICII